MRRGLSIVGVAVVAFAMGLATASGLRTARGDVKDLELDFSPDEITIQVLEHARKRPFVLGWSEGQLPGPGDLRLLPPEGPVRIPRKPPTPLVIYEVVPMWEWDPTQLWRPCDPAICTPVPRDTMRDMVQELLPRCLPVGPVETKTNCTNGRDDDCDGLTDGADPDCQRR